MHSVAFDWNKFGIDLFTVLIPLATTVAVYHIKAFLVGKPQIVLQFINLVLSNAILYIKALVDGGTVDPLLAIYLSGVAVFLANILTGIGASNRVKKLLRVKGHKRLPDSVSAPKIAA